MKKLKDQPQSALQFFGYRYPPFADTFEIAQPYLSESESLILQRTLALLRQGRSVAVYGEAGSGKSMLVKSIVSQLDSKEFRTVQIPYGGIKPAALLRDLCEEFDIDTGGRKNLLSRLAADFRRSSDKPFPVIIVDEAHEMQKSSFIDLCSLLHDARLRTSAAAVVLVGQPVLRKMLELDIFSPVRTRLTCLFQMPRLTLDDAKEFISFRLHAAQAEKSLFDSEALDCLATDAKGNRRVLMNLAALCLEEAARRNDKVVTAEVVNAVTMEYQL
ncbi:MAG: ExeA family protein [Chitinispirillaceae bacterium]